MESIRLRARGSRAQVLLVVSLFTVPLLLVGCTRAKRPTPDKEQAVDYVVERMHTLTWTDYNGASDPEMVRYLLDGEEVQPLKDGYAGVIDKVTYLKTEKRFLLKDLEQHPGRQRTISLASRITDMKEGEYLLIHPSYLVGREPYGLDRHYPWNRRSVRVNIEGIAISREIQVLYGEPAKAIHSPDEGLAYREKHLKARDPTTPAEELRELAADGDREVRALVACNAKVTAEILCRLASDTDLAVKANVAANASTPGDVLRKLANDGYYLRKEIAGNPSAPVDLLRELARDSDKSVSERAKERLEGLGDGP